MSLKCTLAASVVTLTMAGAAHSDDLAPMAAQRIGLGEMAGVAYYTVEGDGYRVVATVAAAGASPLRFVATLLPGQRVVLSVPGAVDQTGSSIELTRIGNRLIVTEGAKPGVLADTSLPQTR